MQQGAKIHKKSVYRLFHPDYTVGPGVSPGQHLKQQVVAGYTAGGELHPALKRTF